MVQELMLTLKPVGEPGKIQVLREKISGSQQKLEQRLKITKVLRKR